MKSSFRTLATVAVLAQLSLGACVNTEREIAASRPDPRREFTPLAGREQRLNGATTLKTVRATHLFSSPQAPDVFLLQLRGPRVLGSHLHFIVIGSQGDTLYHEMLPARTLLDDPALRDNSSASARDKEISILRGMNAFFDPAQFVHPAVPAATPPPAAVDAQAWQSLRRDSAAVGFDFTSASGAPKRLVYLRQLSRVVVLSE